MKKLWIIVLCMLIIVLSACGSKTGTGNPIAALETLPETVAETAVPDPSIEEAKDGKTLVVVFSTTGTTKGVAEKIAAIENADLYEIVAQEPYSDADRNWQDANSRTTKEQSSPSVRPAIASEALNLSGYDRIYIGYPIWWGEEPRILDTFVESYDFSGITMIPFCTSASSGIGSSGQNLAQNAGSGTWLEGRRFSGDVSDTQLQSWIDSLT